MHDPPVTLATVEQALDAMIHEARKTTDDLAAVIAREVQPPDPDEDVPPVVVDSEEVGHD